jgi:uncharacterized protein YkwD
VGRRIGLTFAALLAVALIGPAPASADYCEGEDAAVTAGNAEAAETAQLCLINVHRATSGLPPLTMDPALRTAARGHARWMDENNSFCTSPDPNAEPPIVCDGSPDSRAALAGYPHATGENNAWENGSTSRQLFEHWRSGLGNSNMLFFDYDTVGIGFFRGSHGLVGTQHFGVEPNGATETAVSLLRRDGCPAAEKALRRAERKLDRADSRQERKRAKRKLRKAKRALRVQCHPGSYEGSSLSAP